MKDELTFEAGFYGFIFMVFGMGIVMGREFNLNGFGFMYLGLVFILLGAFFSDKNIKRNNYAKSKSI